MVCGTITIVPFMPPALPESETISFLKSLGFPALAVHHSFNHFDFKRPSRRILVIGPMGSGKTEYSSRVWRDSQVALKKSRAIEAITTLSEADRRKVFFIRSSLDMQRFPEYPDDALAYRGGFIRCGTKIARIQGSFELERIIAANPNVGTWIIDEASFYDERLVYVVKNESISRGLIFIFPTLVLNFRKDIFNATARLLLENATDVFPLTAYCEHKDCIEDSFYTYRYYTVGGKECPALYFDPLIIIGGDREEQNPRQPNYCTRCDTHHYLPGKEYTYFILKPLGEQASRGNVSELTEELSAIKHNIKKSRLFGLFEKNYTGNTERMINFNALDVPNIPEKALIYLFAEANLVSENQMKEMTKKLSLDRDYLGRSLQDNHRSVQFD